MQDKKHHTPSHEETFVNEAWAQMAQLLDEQMPVAALPWWRQRRYYLLLLLLLLFLTSAAGLWWNQQTPAPSVPAKPEGPGAIAQQPTMATGETADKQQLNPRLAEANEASSPHADVLIPPAFRSAVSLPTPQSGAIAQIPTRIEVLQSTESELLDMRLSAEIPEQLSSLELEPLALSMQAPGHTAIDLITPPSRWSLSTTAGVGMQTSSGHISLGWLDTRVQRKLGNAGKWSLGAGLGILYAQFPGRLEYGAGIHPESISSGSSGWLFSADFENLSTDERKALQEATLAMRYTFLRVPLEVDRRLTTRLRLRFGAEAGLLLLLNTPSTSMYRADQSPSNAIPPSISDVLQTKRLDTRLLLGLGYRISPNLEADLRYQFGLVKLHPQYSLPTYNRFLELGLRWNW